MTAEQALRHLQQRAQRTSDAIGNRSSGAKWSVRDVEAVRVLVNHLEAVGSVEVANLHRRLSEALHG